MSFNYKIGDSRVLESRESADGVTIRRRRVTSDGKHRFTTYERVERPNLAVVKNSGERELFDREKLLVAVSRSVGKFFDSDLEIEEIINSVEDRLYAEGDNEVTSKQIGTFVLEELASRNEVAYVRFASVFLKFETLDDFVRILDKIRKGK